MSQTFSRALVFLCLAMPAVVAACTPIGIATGVGAATGIAAAREGGLRATLNDIAIQSDINDLWFRYDVETFRRLDLTVNQGRVLITGVVQDPADRVEAVRLAWQPDGVQQVINEIQVAGSDGVPGFLRDKWITTRLRTRITLDREVQSVNYSIDTVQGTVYLMGVAQSQRELNRVTEAARTIEHVREVVSYVKISGPGQQQAAGHPAPAAGESMNGDHGAQDASEPGDLYRSPADGPAGGTVIDAEPLNP